jgi:hypothetical protein
LETSLSRRCGPKCRGCSCMFRSSTMWKNILLRSPRRRPASSRVVRRPKSVLILNGLVLMLLYFSSPRHENNKAVKHVSVVRSIFWCIVTVKHLIAITASHHSEPEKSH